ncbi:hypothetical protein MBLNU459_g4547t2 [Dothideomycetes sp. NU459]
MSPSTTSILLRGGTVIVHDEQDHVTCSPNTDILIVGNKIEKISRDIQAPDGAETQLKGRHANELLLDYFSSGSYFTSSIFSATDVFWGQLGGCLEMLHAGTTTVVDHAHMNYTPDHNHNAISATVSSGIRSVFCYVPTTRLASWHPFEVNNDYLEPWVLSTFDALAAAAPFGDNGTVTLGFGFDGWFLPREAIHSLFARVKRAGVQTVTTHCVAPPSLAAGGSSLFATLDSYGLLDEHMLLSHCTGMDARDAGLCLDRKAWISSTPDTELQMALGTSVCFRDDLGVQSRCSLGVDCHSNNSGGIVSQMRLGLQAARGRSNEAFHNAGKDPVRVHKTVEEAYNLGTVAGARALNRADALGSIAPGKLADLVIFSGTSPAMVCAAAHDPVAAIVLHSSPADIETVLVDGRVVKRDGRLVATRLDSWGRSVVGGGADEVGWGEVARRLGDSRKRIQGQIERHDAVEARKGVIGAFHFDESKIAESV